MKKELSVLFSCFSGINPLFVPDHVDSDFIPSNSDIDNILNDIFSVDERTGLPKGDIAYYLSDSGNPQVKEWLLTNLLKPRSASSGSSIEGVTDDLLAECAREPNESNFAYASRLNSIITEARSFLEKNKNNSDND